jgi:hypothetical protein
MSLKMNRIGIACVCAVLLCGSTQLARATSFDLNFDEGHDYPLGALTAGATLSTVTTVYQPLYGIQIAEPANGWNISQLGGCCGGDGWLNVGYAPEGRLHWFVNAAPGS